jgi:3-keto-5-aminohexanoate cleavage enzyme
MVISPTERLDGCPEPKEFMMHAAAEPLILNLAPTGTVATRELSPHVPLQPDEIISDVVAAAQAGITIAHLHARDASGSPTHRQEVFARIICGIRDQVPDLVICVSCSGRQVKRFSQRAEVLNLAGDAKPDMASLTPSSLNFSQQASVNSPELVLQLAKRMQDRDIVPELAIYDLGMVHMLHYLRQKNAIAEPFYVNLLLGNPATAQADLLEMGVLVDKLPEETVWSLAGLGRAQLPVAAIAAAVAPGVRVGLEDNLWLDQDRRQPARNGDLVERVHRFAESLGRSIMSPTEFRQRLVLSPPHTSGRSAA